MLIAESKKTIWKNSNVSNVYMYPYVDFEGVEFYVTLRYVILTKEGREEDLIFNNKEEKEDDVLSSSFSSLLLKIKSSSLPSFVKFTYHNVT